MSALRPARHAFVSLMDATRTQEQEPSLAILARIAKDVSGHCVRTLAEQVSLAQQVACARARPACLITECATPVVLP